MSDSRQVTEQPADGAATKSAPSDGPRQPNRARQLTPPQDFYRKLATRPDVSRILERLAK